MALTVGELTGFIDLDDKGFSAGLQAAGRDLGKLQSTTSTATSSIESTVERSFDEISRAIADGLDPADAIADLDRLEAALDQGFRDMEAEADAFAAELDAAIDAAFADMEAEARSGARNTVNAIDQEFASLDNDLREAGRRGGDALTDGLESGLSGAGPAGRGAGRDAADGVGQGGSSGIASAAADLIGGFKGAGWLAAGAAVGGLLISGIKTAMEKEDLLAELAVKVGSFGQESERLGKIAGELYAQAYGESFGDVTDALTKVVQNIDGASKASDEALGAMTKQALTVGKAMDEDVGAVTRAVSQILRNDLAPNAEAAFNVLLRGQQEGVNKSEDLLDTFNEYGTIFRDLGLSAEDALGLMSQGLKAGARDSDTVADALKELDIRVKDMSAKDALKELGLNAKDMASAFAKGGPRAREALDTILDRLGKVKDPAERSRLAVELFGTKAEDMAGSINALNLDKAKTAVGGFEGAVKQADKTLQTTASTGTEQWARSWEGVLAGVGEHITKWFKDMFPSPADIEAEWNQVTEWFSGTVGPFFTDIWNSVSETTSEIWTGIGEWLSAKSQEIVEWLKQAPQKIGEFFASGWEWIRTKTSEIWTGIGQWLSTKTNEILEWLKSVPTKVGEFFSTGWESVKTVTTEKWEGIKAAAVEKTNSLLTWLKELPNKIREFFSAAGTWLLQAGRDLITGMITGVKEKAGELLNAARSVVDNAVKGVTNFLDSHSPSRLTRDEIGTPIIQGVIVGITEQEGALVGTLQGTAAKAIAAISEPLAPGQPGTKPAGERVVQGVIEGVKAKEPTLAKTVTETAKKAVKAALEPLAPGQPGAKPAGERLSQSIAEGVLAQEGTVLGAVAKVVAAAKGAAAKGAAEISKALTTGKTATVGRYLDDAPLPVLTSKNAYMGAGASSPAIASDAAGSPTGWSSYGQSGVTVNMYGTTVREQADISRIGQEFAFQMATSV